MQTGHQTSEIAAGPGVIEIELLALDLSSCTRCVGTLENIEKAIDTVRPALEETGVQVKVNRLIIETEEQARQHRFATSPTVRINGNDIALEILESHCDSCTDLCGCDEGTNCRVWRYQGKEYTEAPLGLIVEALLHEVIGSDRAEGGTFVYQEVPENLSRFFASKSAKHAAGAECCLPSTDQDARGAPDDDAECCGASGREPCDCR